MAVLTRAVPETKAGGSSPVEAVAGALGAATTFGLALLLAVAPWPIGSVGPTASWVIVVAAWALLALRSFTLLLRNRGRVPLPASVATAAFAFLLVLGWAALQAGVALEPSWTHPIRDALPADVPFFASPSLDPDRTAEAVCRLSAYLAVGVLAYLAARDRARAHRLLGVVVAFTLVQALFGLVRMAFPDLSELFGLPRAAGRAAGSFVNPNHFAAYVNLGLVAVLVLLLDRLRTEADSPRLASALGRALIATFERHTVLLAVLVVLVMASFASGSRGGFLSLLLTLVIVVPWRSGGGRLVLAGGLLFLALGAALILTAGLPTLERLDQLFPASELEPGAGGRLAVFGLALEAWWQRPWLGHGLGAWASLFHTLRDERFPLVTFDYAHNTWLELLAELGAPAFLAWIAAFAILLRLCVVASRSRDPLPAIGVGCGLLVGLHSLVDFPAQIPAVAVTWAALLGLAVGRAASLRAVRSGSPSRVQDTGPAGFTAAAGSANKLLGIGRLTSG